MRIEEALTNLEEKIIFAINKYSELQKDYQNILNENEKLKKELKRRSLPRTKKSNKQLSLI